MATNCIWQITMENDNDKNRLMGCIGYNSLFWLLSVNKFQFRDMYTWSSYNKLFHSNNKSNSME